MYRETHRVLFFELSFYVLLSLCPSRVRLSFDCWVLLMYLSSCLLLAGKPVLSNASAFKLLHSFIVNSNTFPLPTFAWIPDSYFGCSLKVILV